MGSIPSGYEVDHKDSNPMNNSKDNLRIAENARASGNPAPELSDSLLPDILLDRTGDAGRIWRD